ncbi:hypothetical protein PT974_09460 [Cladobotryum mycophilum]|uniref:Peptidase S8/S53 domain-containing protein n=1 Tax=Cladobotryum mycophilum TaxID=491253 RepID=A0ABR0SG81_9HYPO
MNAASNPYVGLPFNEVRDDAIIARPRRPQQRGPVVVIRHAHVRVFEFTQEIPYTGAVSKRHCKVDWKASKLILHINVRAGINKGPFATEMKIFWEDTLQDFMSWRKNQGTPERVEEDVVVALIDDGVDRFYVTPSSQVLEGKSFDFHDGKVRPSFSSARGHGTVTATMILRAIEAALGKKAGIISMSWTLPMATAKKETTNKLQNVLQRAVNEKVLMFCSSPDEGKFTQLDYPSGPWPNDFFRIGAARADGTVFEWTQEAGIAFVLPGVDVIKEHMDSDRVVDFKYETGSSVATALAAGLAAIIIYCVKASILAVKTANQNKGSVVGIAIPDDAVKKIAKHDSMRQAIFSLGTMTSNRFIQVWEELDGVSDMLERSRARSLTPDDKRHRTEEFVRFGFKLMNSSQSDGSKVGRL